MWGFRAIAKKHEIPPVEVRRLTRGKYQKGLDDSSSDDDDDSGDYDSDRTFSPFLGGRRGLRVGMK